MRLLHYTAAPFVFDPSRTYGADDGCGHGKTPGFWVSVEGESDWPEWCRGEDWGLARLAHAAEVILAPEAEVHRIESLGAFDAFNAEFALPERRLGAKLDWPRIRRAFDGLIIAPYQWERRLSMDADWYYTWDCASGVIWNLRAVSHVRPIEEDRK